MYQEVSLRSALLQGKEPAWLRESIPERLWQHEKSTALVTGRLDGPNPTHQVFMPALPSYLEFAGTYQSTSLMSEGSCLSVAGALHECVRSLCSVAPPHLGSQVNTFTATWSLMMRMPLHASQFTPKLT